MRLSYVEVSGKYATPPEIGFVNDAGHPFDFSTGLFANAPRQGRATMVKVAGEDAWCAFVPLPDDVTAAARLWVGGEIIAVAAGEQPARGRGLVFAL